MISIEQNKNKIIDGLDNAYIHGYSIIKKFFSKEELIKLRDSHKEVFSTHKRSRGNKIVELHKTELKRFTLLNYYMNLINSLMNTNFKKKFYLDKVWFEKKIFEINTDEDYQNKLPYIPHIDRNRFFKAMIYLNKTDEENGAIIFCKKSPDKLENFRGELLLNNNYSNVIKDKSLDFFSINGDAGDLIFFDTNCPHMAGIGKKNMYRDIIRIDFETLNWNKKTFLSKSKLVLKDLFS